ncbi:MAG: helix-turn-helix domain-containing protein [Bacteroides sp.]|nr:helix-turn-helix domain-containing protein [Bacteroides sp.]
MDYQLNTRLNGNVAMTYRYHESVQLQRDKTLYKFIWVQSGTLTVEVDHIPMRLSQDEIITLTPPLHHLEVKEVDGEYLTFVFNSNFYCIYGHDNEVSCNGFLFFGSSKVMRLTLSAEQSSNLHDIVRIFRQESAIHDNLQEEMLRIVLKRFIITCTRIARRKFGVGKENEKSFDIIRQFYVLVDQNFKEKKQVQDYADILCRSPKTLSNLFASCGLPSPLRVIHERIEAEAMRLLLYTRKSAKEISAILGFEDLAAFSRFFKKMTGESLSDYRKRGQREELPTVTE